MQVPVTQEPTISVGVDSALSIASRRHPLRIVHIVSSLKVGGMERFVLRIAAAQSSQHHVSILALQNGPLLEEAKEMGLGVHVLGGYQKHFRAVRGAITLLKLRPDIAHAHNQTSLHYAVLAKRVAGARVVMTNHGQGLGSARTPSSTEWRYTDRVVAVSHAVADRMDQGALQGKIAVILNGIESRKPERTRAEVRGDLGLGEGLVGLIVARIDGRKGHDTILRALAHLKEQRIALTVLVAGDGDERANMEAQAQTLGLNSDDVRFLGFRADVPDLHAASDLFLLPSVTEGLPLSVLEAMSAAKPVVATPVGGIPELVEHGRHGLLVPVGDDLALSDAIAQIAQDQALRDRMGRAASERVELEFTFGQMTERYEDLYAETIGAK